MNFRARPKTSRERKNSNSDNSKSPSINKTQDENQKCHSHRQCSCKNRIHKYPDYLTPMRQQRIKMRQEKRKIVENILEMPVIVDQQEIENESGNKHQRQKQSEREVPFVNNYSNQLSEYQETPRKSILESFHDSIIKSGRKLPTCQSKFNLTPKSPRNSPKKTDFSFVVSVQIEEDGVGKLYSRNFSALQYGAKAIKCIEDIMKEKLIA